MKNSGYLVSLDCRLTVVPLPHGSEPSPSKSWPIKCFGVVTVLRMVGCCPCIPRT